MQRLCLLLLWVGVGLSSSPLVGQEEKRDGSFGFEGKRIFKFHRGVGPVATGDLDLDGKTDMVVADGYRAELVLLVQDSEQRGKTHDKGPNSVNDPDGFRRVALPIPSKVDSMLIRDVDGDGRPDLLLTGSGALEVRWGSEDLRFQERDRYRLQDGVTGRSVVADQNVKDRLEVYILAKKGIHRFRRFSREKAPERDFLPGSAGNPTALFLTDLDGDGSRDLLTVLNDREHPYRVRFFRGEAFGPETVLQGELPQTVLPVEGREGAQIVAMALGKGRFDILGLSTGSRRDSLDLPPPEVFPLDAGGLEEPRLLVADLDGDGDTDIAVTHRTENQILVFLNVGGQLVAAGPSPTLRKVVSLQHIIPPAGGPPEVLVTSAEEKVIGTSTMDEGKLRFPKVIGGISAPVLAAGGRFQGGDSHLVVVIRESGNLVLRVLQKTGTEGWDIRFEQPLTGVNSDPVDLLASDLDDDGNDEIVVFVPYQAPALFGLVEKNGEVALQKIPAPGVLEKSSRGSVSVTLEKHLLVASTNHCRRVRLQAGKPEVVYQVNGSSGSSAIVCAIEARLEADKPPHLLLVDKNDRTLTVYGGTGSQPTALRTLTGAFDQIRQAEVADLDGDGLDEIILLDPRFLAVIRTDGRRLELTSRFTYQHPDEKTRFVTAATGDLNGNGETDLVLSNGSLRELQLLKRATGFEWKHALRFPVYEAKSFASRGTGPMEPRWVSVVDLTDDGLEDLLILVHDRVILYPQDRAI